MNVASIKWNISFKMYEIPNYFPQCNNQFSILLEPLLLSFNSSVSTASIDDLYKSTLLWVEQHCSLVDLRPGLYTREIFKNVHLNILIVLCKVCMVQKVNSKKKKSLKIITSITSTRSF